MIGFSFLKDSLNFVEIVNENGQPAIRQFAKRPSSPQFIHENLVSPHSQEFKTMISEAAQQYNLSGPVVVSLDSGLALIKKFLADPAQDDDQILEQLRWEYRQIFPEAAIREYSLVFERIKSGFHEGREEILTVAFRKDILQTVTGLFEDSPLSLSRVDLDLFSALHGIKQIYTPEPGFIVLADIRRDTVKIQFARNAEAFDFHNVTLTSEGENANSEAFESEESLSRLLNKEIRRKLMEYRLGNEEKAIDVLYLFGENANAALSEYMAISPAREVNLVEPFRRMEISSDMGEISGKLALSSEYIICIGSALRLQ